MEANQVARTILSKNWEQFKYANILGAIDITHLIDLFQNYKVDKKQQFIYVKQSKYRYDPNIIHELNKYIHIDIIQTYLNKLLEFSKEFKDAYDKITVGIYQQLVTSGYITQNTMNLILEYQYEIQHVSEVGKKHSKMDDLMRIRSSNKLTGTGFAIETGKREIDYKIHKIENAIIKWKSLPEDLRAIINADFIQALITGSFEDASENITNEEIYERGDHLKDPVIDFINRY